LRPDDGARVDADAAEQRQEAVETAVLADLLGVVAGRHARQEVGENTHAAVAETPAQTVLPLASFARHIPKICCKFGAAEK